MQKDLLSNIDKKIQELKDEYSDLSEQLAELEAKAKAKQEEITRLIEKKRWEEEKNRLENEFSDTFAKLIKHNRQTIPSFLNDSYSQLLDIANKYDNLVKEEKELFKAFDLLKKKLLSMDVSVEEIQNKTQESADKPVELNSALIALLKIIEENRALWIQDRDTILRFLDTGRLIPIKRW